MRNVSRSVLCALLFASSFITSAPAAFAQSEQQGTAEQRAACTPDVFRLCGSEIPSIERIVMCLKREKSNLSAGCKAVFASR